MQYQLDLVSNWYHINMWTEKAEKSNKNYTIHTKNTQMLSEAQEWNRPNFMTLYN